MVMIGLETHVQLDTETKLFCSCENGESEEPNSNVCPTCLGHPGSKPAINEKVIDLGLKTSIALGCEVNEDFFFSRKTYFYPDMSKNYQITQFELPVGEHGDFEIKVGDEKKEIGITRLHIEEDPAKLVHEGGSISNSKYTKVDYNRAGTPLLEIVTDPDFETPEEARAYLQQLSQMLEYLGVYDPESDFAIKSDANISIEGGERVEVKNITGTSAIEKALNYEISRQKQLKKRGREITQQTRGFNADMGTTEKMREKETEEDYGYIFDPDLTRQKNSEEDISEASDEIPELPHEKFDRFKEDYNLKDKLVESLVTEPELADDFEVLAERYDSGMVASWMTGDVKKVLNYHESSYAESALSLRFLSELFELLDKDDLTDKEGENRLREQMENPLMYTNPATAEVNGGESKLREKAEDEDLLKSGDDEVSDFVKEAIEENPEAVNDYESGDEGAINFLVGQVMGISQGKADPKKAREMILEELE